MLDVIPDLELLAKAHEVGDEVATVLERVHDVRESAGMLESKRVAQLMNTGQIYDRIPEERIQPRPLCDVQPESLGIRMHEHIGSEPPVHYSSLHLAV